MNTFGTTLEKPVKTSPEPKPKAEPKAKAESKPEMVKVFIPTVPGLEILDAMVDGELQKSIALWINGEKLHVPVDKHYEVPANFAPLVKEYVQVNRK